MSQEVKVGAYLSEDVVGLLDVFITKLMGSTMVEGERGGIHHDL